VRLASARGAMTQSDFAALLQVDRKTVVRWETGQRMPDCDSLLNMKQRLRISVDWLLTGQGEAAAAGALPAEDLQALESYRALDADGRKAALRAMQMEQLRMRAEGPAPVKYSMPPPTVLLIDETVHAAASVAAAPAAPKVRRVPKAPKA